MTTTMSTTNEPKIHTTTELSAQKKTVKLGLKKELILNQIWVPVASGWFNQWKKYVDFVDECVEQRPGRCLPRCVSLPTLSIDEHLFVSLSYVFYQQMMLYDPCILVRSTIVFSMWVLMVTNCVVV